MAPSNAFSEKTPAVFLTSEANGIKRRNLGKYCRMTILKSAVFVANTSTRLAWLRYFNTIICNKHEDNITDRRAILLTFVYHANIINLS